MPTDSVSVFAEGTFEEQIKELVDYLTRSRPEAERSTFRQPLDDLLKTEASQKTFEQDNERKRKVISSVVDAIGNLGDGSDREIEGFFNLTFSHLLEVYPTNTPELSSNVTKLIHTILASSAEHAPVTYRILANLFNALPRTSSVRLLVCEALLKLAAESDDIDTLQLSPSDVDRWLAEWKASAEEKSQFMKTVVETYYSVGRFDAAYAFSISYVQSIPSSSEAANREGLRLIATALRLPSVFDFDSLLQLGNIRALSSHTLYHLLDIFNKKGMSEFYDWKDKNQATLDEYQLAVPILERKMRLLVLSELAFSKIGQSVSYLDVASALKIEVSDVEKWVIDVIRAGLVSGKLSQTTQALLVIRASPRGFGVEQWSSLEQRLIAWKNGLLGIQNVLTTVRQSANGVTQASVLDKVGNAQEQAA